MTGGKSKVLKRYGADSELSSSTPRARVRSSFDLKIHQSRGANSFFAYVVENEVTNSNLINFLAGGGSLCYVGFASGWGFYHFQIAVPHPDQPTQSNNSTTHPNPPTNEEKHGGEK